MTMSYTMTPCPRNKNFGQNSDSACSGTHRFRNTQKTGHSKSQIFEGATVGAATEGRPYNCPCNDLYTVEANYERHADAKTHAWKK